MRNRMTTSAIYLMILSFLGGCGDGGSEQEQVPGVKGEPLDGIRIAWDYSSMQRLAPQGDRSLSWVGYPRVRRLEDGTLMAVYETGGDGEMVYSTNNGASWNGPFITFRKHSVTNAGGTTEVNIANSELIQLQNGDLVMACNYRPTTPEITPFAIVVRRSSDGGKNWTDDQVIYEGGPRFTDGCWEPAFLQLPDGGLQVYFANETPFQTSNEQNISMISSPDHGVTWSKDVKTVCFRAGRRDGMPVPLLIGDEILVAIEDNKIGEFKPYIVRSKIADNWKAPVLADSPDRQYALEKPLQDGIYAGAPYLMRVPSGEVLLSYQTTGGRTSDWERSTMEVAIGDPAGRHFEKLSRPFDVPMDREAKWNSLSLWDENTVVAASTTSFRSPNCEVWIIKGHVIPELEALTGVIVADGRITEEEWGAAFPVFIGHKGPANLRANFRCDEQIFYVCGAVTDSKLVQGDRPDQSDGVFLYLDAENSCQLSPGPGMYRIFCDTRGKLMAEEGKDGQWKAVPSGEIEAKAAIADGSGYQIEWKVPFSAIGKNDRSDIRINFGLREFGGPVPGYEENMENSVPASSNTWCRLQFK